MSRRTSVIFGVVLAVAVSTGGCKGKPPLVAPGDAEGKAAVGRKLGKDLKLLSFKVTSTVLDEPRKMAKMVYECEVEVTEDCRYSPPFRTYPLDDSESKREKENLFDLPPPGDPVKQGERKTVRGAILFQHTLEGWEATKFGVLP